MINGVVVFLLQGWRCFRFNEET